MEPVTEESVELVYPSSVSYMDLFGLEDSNIRTLEARYGVEIVCRDGGIKILGNSIAARKTARIIREMEELIVHGAQIDEHTLSGALDYLEKGGADGKVGFETIILNAKGRQIRPRSLGQCLYLDAMIGKDVVFAIGPAGTGKTYLAVACAVSALKAHTVQKIILCRPAVEAGESLGFLPGDLRDKVEPYFRPLYDALFETLGPEKLEKLQDRGIVEVAPLAYMRGRTLANAFIILDEAQNTSAIQMKMILTRLGAGSKMIITGDSTQVDLPHNVEPGLRQIESILGDVDGVSFIRLTKRDVVRHKLVQDIISAYETHDTDTGPDASPEESRT
jgi:phosphate starvation-inducible protein PhoH and related proteins